MPSINFRGHSIMYVNRDSFFKSVESGEWEKETFDVLDKYIEKGKTFIDIGAWNGMISMYAGLLGAKCYAIEPDAVAYKELVENITINGLTENVDTANIALSYQNGVAELNSMTNGFGNSESSLVERGAVDGIRVVQTQTFYSLLSINHIKDVCLIKIDAEGSEQLFLNYSFLSGLIAIGEMPPIYISVHPAWIKDIDIFIHDFYFNFSVFYNFTNATNGKEYNPIDFSEALKTSHEHSFLLLKK
jgi:FkbM family methyltransferase